ncbi:hypothetical protein [Bdellovibrio svalbardensis]|uniref:Alginate export domain-containing protein n=1 Tax=Bdellovibrio svalbardensis TaxID=2972972 RepID=A0ABT6DEX7_9BACT|nr:hypothetical protein [Bdellovibrio svalbardensis]MDG0815396.1 hypothetical protein [Bdellovibrio svalbardensis]
MLNTKLIKVLGLSIALMSSTAGAMSLDWSGGYRAEWTEVDKPTLGSPSGRKSYATNFLYLSPKIIAADGININTRFDILTNSFYQNSQLGEIWGLNNNSPVVTAQNQGSSAVRVSQLYLTVNQEYGALMVGRVPWEFGIGMTYNAGKGAFDHWYDTRDMIAYKIVVGDWFVMPMLGRQQSQDFGQGNTISTLGVQLQYENAENKSLIGVMMETKKGANTVLDYTTSQMNAYGANPAAAKNSLNETTTSFVLGRGFDSFGFKVEASFLQGETGLVDIYGSDVRLSGYGIAAELYFPQAQSKWDWKVKLGMATGDDPSSTGFGGFAFDKNYDVGILLFNHRLGGADFLQTDTVKQSTGSNGSALSVGNSADDESVSNAVYLAPSVNYTWTDKLDFRNTIVWAQLLNTQKNSVDAKKDLGLEWDIELVYKPHERIQWVNQIGLLFPGEAWKNGTGAGGNLSNDFTFGLASKAAISF